VAELERQEAEFRAKEAEIERMERVRLSIFSVLAIVWDMGWWRRLFQPRVTVWPQSASADHRQEHPHWNVDNISKDKKSRTMINKDPEPNTVARSRVSCLTLI
jgi:hypothetical protein